MTLTELTVTIGLAGTLMAIAVSNYNQMMRKEEAQRQYKEVKALMRELQTEAMFRKRDVQIAITPEGIKAVSIPYQTTSTITYKALDIGHPNLPYPPTDPPIPGQPPPEVPKNFEYKFKFPSKTYQALYIETRGYYYTLNEDNSMNTTPVALCFDMPNDVPMDSYIVYPTMPREERLPAGKSCEYASFITSD